MSVDFRILVVFIISVISVANEVYASSRYMPALQDFAGVENVVFIVRAKPLDGRVEYPNVDFTEGALVEFKTVFQEILHEIPEVGVFHFFEINSDDYKDERNLMIFVQVTFSEDLDPVLNKRRTLASVDVQMRRGQAKSAIWDRGVTASFFMSENRGDFVNQVSRSLQSILGYLPNYIACANPERIAYECQGAKFRENK